MEFWLVVGREMNKNQLKHLIIKSNTGKMLQMTVLQLRDFSKKNRVINVKFSGDQMLGVEISLLSIPTYRKNAMGFMEQVSGASEQEIISKGMQVANRVFAAEQSKQANSTNKDQELKNKRIQYLIDKLNICNMIVDTALQMKDLTNNQVLLDSISRYLKQIDIDNAGDDISQMIQRYGVNGLANGLTDRLQRIKERARKFSLLNEQLNGTTIANAVKISESKVEELRKKHAETHKLVKDNKVSLEKQEEIEENTILIEDEQEEIEENAILIEDEEHIEENAIILDDEPCNEILIGESSDENRVEIEDEKNNELHSDNTVQYHTIESTGETLEIVNESFSKLKDLEIEKIPKFANMYHSYVSNSIKEAVGLGMTKDKYIKNLTSIAKNLIINTDWAYIASHGKEGYTRCIQLDKCIEQINNDMINSCIKNIKSYQQDMTTCSYRIKQLKEQLTILNMNADHLNSIISGKDARSELINIIEDNLCDTFLYNIEHMHSNEYSYYDIVGVNVLYYIVKSLKSWDADIHIPEHDDCRPKTYGREFDCRSDIWLIGDEYDMSSVAVYNAMIDVIGEYANSLPKWFSNSVKRICDHFEDDIFMNGSYLLKKAYDDYSYSMSSSIEDRMDWHRIGMNKFINTVVEAAEELQKHACTVDNKQSAVEELSRVNKDIRDTKSAIAKCNKNIEDSKKMVGIYTGVDVNSPFFNLMLKPLKSIIE